MRKTWVPATTLLLIGIAAPAASSDYFLTIDGVAGDSSSEAIYLKVHAADLDGDGATDEGIVKLTCSGGVMDALLHTVKSPRDVATGQSSGKRTHKPMKIIKEWDAATPQLAAMKPTYDVKKVEGSGARSAGGDPAWSPIALSNADGLCAEAARAVKTRSNIQNN